MPGGHTYRQTMPTSWPAANARRARGYSVLWGPEHDYPNARDLLCGLRLNSRWPDEETKGERRDEEEAAGKAGNERASRDRWITSSARASSDGGMVRLSALAVLRLITSSNLVGCSIGRSAGLAPLRVLSTYRAARRFKSGRFTP